MQYFSSYNDIANKQKLNHTKAFKQKNNHQQYTQMIRKIGTVRSRHWIFWILIHLLDLEPNQRKADSARSLQSNIAVTTALQSKQ